MRVAYADPPYPGMSHFYKDHPDYGGEVDHVDLIKYLDTFDGWVLHTASTTLGHVLWAAGKAVEPSVRKDNEIRVMAWVKSFASFKPGNPVAYAWEPVLVKQARKPEVDKSMTWRDWICEPITLRRGLTGVKPEAVCHWAFRVVGMERDDELVDLFPGSGAVTRAWDSWRAGSAVVTHICCLCHKPITFYMHTVYIDGRAAYCHPECCPEERCKEKHK